MGIGKNLSETKGRELCELREETNTNTTNSNNNKSRRNRRHRQRKMSPGQKLFQTCNEVFASTGPGIVPSPQNIEMLLSVLGTRSASITLVQIVHFGFFLIVYVIFYFFCYLVFHFDNSNLHKSEILKNG